MTFAGPLAVHGIAGEALQLLRGSSILGALESKFRRVPFRTTVPYRFCGSHLKRWTRFRTAYRNR